MMSVRKRPRYLEVDGFLLPTCSQAEVFRSSVDYKPQKNDVIVASYPKCGTTWMIQIVTLIVRKGIPPADFQEYFASYYFLEMSGSEVLSKLPKKPYCIKTHLPFDHLSQNFSSDAKYIYVTRHPADCVVSFYYHTKFFPMYCFSDGSFDDYFELFIKGETDFNDYFDNLLSWYATREEPNVLFVTYESMKRDPRGIIFKVAEFLGEDYHKSLTSTVLNDILRYTSFEYMQETLNIYWENYFAKGFFPEDYQENYPFVRKFAECTEAASQEGHFSYGNFIRRGEVGEGKLCLSKEQKAKLDARIQEKTQGSDVMSLWTAL